MSVINVQGLTMVYKAPVRKEGLRAAFTSLFKRTYREIRAVQGVSFEVTAGEVVGFIGPNGAGKTTTLKTLSGILHPTGGEVSVLGYTPWHRTSAFLRNLALIRGSQPIGGPVELTVLDSLRYQQLVYEVPAASFKQNLSELVAMLDLEPLLSRQIRALSLGERMHCGLALALIYRPRILFLDEPTLGLDVTAVGMMRRFLSTYSRQTGATILLTYILPFAFIATFPASALLGRADPLLPILGLLICALAFPLVQLVWHVGLRRYTSATS